MGVKEEEEQGLPISFIGSSPNRQESCTRWVVYDLKSTFPGNKDRLKYLPERLALTKEKLQGHIYPISHRERINSTPLNPRSWVCNIDS